MAATDGNIIVKEPTGSNESTGDNHWPDPDFERRLKASEIVMVQDSREAYDLEAKDLRVVV